MQAEDRRLLALHGSPQGIRQYVYPDHSENELAAWLEQEGADVLCLGHTHVPFIRHLPQGLVLKHGSVGKPKDGDPRASYALLELGDQTTAAIIRLPCGLEEKARRLTRAGLPAMTVQKPYKGL